MSNISKVLWALFFTATCNAENDGILKELSHQKIFSVNKESFSKTYPLLSEAKQYAQPFVLPEEVEAFQKELTAFEEDSVSLLNHQKKALMRADRNGKVFRLFRGTFLTNGLLGLNHYISVFPDVFFSFVHVWGFGCWFTYRTVSLLSSFYRALAMARGPIDDVEDTFAKKHIWLPEVLEEHLAKKLSKIRNTLAVREALKKKHHAQRAALQAEADKDMAFVSYALGFAHKPKPPIQASVADVKAGLDRFIDDFFTEYDLDDPAFLEKLKARVHTFAHTLITQEKTEARCLYLYAQDLSDPQAFSEGLTTVLNEYAQVRFEKSVIEKPEDLVGNQEKPGLLAKILHDQDDCYGSVVLCRNAYWLNDPKFSAEARRTFEGDYTPVPTDFLGEAHKNGVILKTPIHLMICSGTGSIEDAKLAKHFDTLVFPKRKAAQAFEIQKDEDIAAEF